MKNLQPLIIETLEKNHGPSRGFFRKPRLYTVEDVAKTISDACPEADPRDARLLAQRYVERGVDLGDRILVFEQQLNEKGQGGVYRTAYKVKLAK